LIALAVAGVAVASDIPPNVTTVVTKCGTPVAVYVTTRKGFAKYDGPVQVAALAAKTPYNLRVEAGCNR
jgi:hypothetical protein